MRDEEVDASGVVVEAAAAVGGLMVVDALGGEANLENALRFVVLDERGPMTSARSPLSCGVSRYDCSLFEKNY